MVNAGRASDKAVAVAKLSDRRLERRGMITALAMAALLSVAIALTLVGRFSTAAFATSISAVEDPIFKIIAAHRREWAKCQQAMIDYGDLECTLPKDRRQSDYDVWNGLVIVETDDPRWIDTVKYCYATTTEADRLALELINVKPITFEGVVALVKHVAEYEKRTIGTITVHDVSYA